MKNKILSALFAFLLTAVTASASDKVHVEAIGEFSTAKPADTINVKVIENTEIGKYNLTEGDVLHCNVVEVSKPKRGKRAAGFKVTPVYYIHGEEHITIDNAPVGKYTKYVMIKEEIKNVDKVKAGKKAALTVGNHFVKGVAPVAALAEGMIKNENGNRLESGVKEVYKSSPVSYIEKGDDISLHAGDIFYFVFQELPGEASVNTDEGNVTEE